MDFIVKLVTWHFITGFVLYVPVLLVLYMNRDQYMKDRAVVILSLLVTLTAWEYFAVCSICRRIMDTADRAEAQFRRRETGVEKDPFQRY